MSLKTRFCILGAVLFCTALIAGPALAEEKPLKPAAPTPSGQDPEDGPGDRETILVRIFTDSYGSETTWDVTQQGGGVVASGGPYGDNTLYEISVSVSPTACYDFCIYDAYGDGICCDYGNGWYEVLYQGAVVGSGGVFTYTDCVYSIGGGCGATIGVSIFTDDYGSETTWDVRDRYGTVVASGGPYDYYNPQLYQYSIPVDPTNCYDFCIYDSWGDGICCNYGYGWYEVTYNGVLVGYGDEFGSVECVNDIADGCCPEAEVVVEVMTDSWPSEITWQLADQGTGVVVCSGGPYALGGTLYTHTCCVKYDGCYDFTIFDAYGDGIYSPGGYAVYYEGTLVYSCIGSGWYGSSETVASIGNCAAADFTVTAPYTSPLRNTCGAGDDCNLVSTSPDHEYEVIIPYASTWSFNTCLFDDPNTALDTMIFVGTSLCSSDIGYNDDACGVWDLQSEVVVDIPAGTYYCTIEHYCCDYCGDYVFQVYDMLGQPNDDCANATPIGDVVDLPFDTTNATLDGPGLCVYSENIWYCYTATCTGMMSVDTCGSSFDTMIAVYDGCDCYPTADQMLCCNDDHCCDGGWTLQSRCNVWVEQGQQYLIEVGGCYDAGPGDLTVRCQPCDYYFDAVTWQGSGNGWPYPDGPGEWIQYPEWINMWWPNEFDLNREKRVWIEFDVEFPCQPGDPYGWLEVVINWTTPDWTDPAAPPFDDAYIVRAPDPPIYIMDPGHYEFEMMLPYCPAWVSMDVRGELFVISGTIVHECLEPQPPPNDDCVNATPIGDVNALPFDTTNATFDGPGLCMTSPNIWYCYTATCTGDATISLCGSSYDTMLAVYDGCECDPIGSMLCCNDDYCGLQSECTIPVVAGQEYLIEVGGYWLNTGAGVLTVSCEGVGPPNDDCIDAELIGDVVDLPFDTTNATLDGPGFCVLSENIWYCYTAPCTGVMTVDTCGSSFDTMIAVYDGCDCYPTADQMLCCNDDHCCDGYTTLQSRCMVWVEEGHQYLIEVGGCYDAGPGDLTVRCDPADYFFDTVTIQGGGNGWPYPEGPGQWFYYPQSNWWNMWWWNEFDMERVKVVRVEFDVEFPCDWGWTEFVINWSTPEWDNPYEPPPDDAFILRAPEPPIYIDQPGHYEFEIILPYCPFWVSVDVRGDWTLIRGTIRHECVCFGSLDGDNDIDLADLAQLLSNYGCTAGCTYWDGDLDSDGDVDLSDLAALLARYGMTCP